MSLFVEVLTLAVAQEIDRTWPSQRPRNATYGDWYWAQILNLTNLGLDVFVARRGGEVIAAWAGEKKRTRDGEEIFELSFLEVHPLKLSMGIGFQTIGEILTRAKEMGCSGVALGALEESVSFYARLGAKRCPPPPPRWSAARGLVGYFLDSIVTEGGVA